jgi:hypothetical protein
LGRTAIPAGLPSAAIADAVADGDATDVHVTTNNIEDTVES